MTWSRLSLEPSSQSAIFKITQTAARQMLASLLDLFALFATTQMPLYKAWDVQRKERKAVAAGTFVELAFFTSNTSLYDLKVAILNAM